MSCEIWFEIYSTTTTTPVKRRFNKTELDERVLKNDYFTQKIMSNKVPPIYAKMRSEFDALMTQVIDDQHYF